MKRIVVVLPHQMFKTSDLIPRYSKDQIYVVEHPLYFSMFPYHKIKLILHRATMKMYFDYLKTQQEVSNATYIEHKDYKTFFENLTKQGCEIVMYDPIDHSVYAEFKEIGVRFKDSPMFYCSNEDVKEYYSKNGGKFCQSEFYKWQRRRFNLLIDEKGKPWGNQWIFDEENRKPSFKGFNNDFEIIKNKSPFVEEAALYIEKYFSYNIGSKKLYLPVSFREAEAFLEAFLIQRFKLFGAFQDAVDSEILVGAHSLLSPLMNVGLLTPKFVVNRAIEFYLANSKEIPFHSLESFVRQIIGWREYVRMVYILEPIKLSEKNHYGHARKISNNWYTGDTGIPPVDAIIKKFLKIGYCHHIERLMYLGNILFLLRTDPKEVYSYFMMFIDAYPWVMEANVFGISQQSSGRLMIRTPYFASSNHVLKMSSYGMRKDSSSRKVCKKEWWEVWDALYFAFIHDNTVELKDSYSTARQVRLLEEKKEGEVKDLLRLAEDYMDSY